MTEHEPASVAQRFAAGEPEASEAVRARVMRILAFGGWGIPSRERQDLGQSVILELWQGVSRPGFDPSRFWGYVETVTACRAIDFGRRRRREPLELTVDPPDPRAGPLRRALDGERLALVEAALAELPPACRELIDLHYRQRKPYAEIATLLGRSEGSLRVQAHRCVRRAGELVRRRMTSEKIRAGR